MKQKQDKKGEKAIMGVLKRIEKRPPNDLNLMEMRNEDLSAGWWNNYEDWFDYPDATPPGL